MKLKLDPKALRLATHLDAWSGDERAAAAALWMWALESQAGELSWPAEVRP